MNQPPNDPYYNAPTEAVGFPPPGSVPAYPSTQAGVPPQQGVYPQQGPVPNYPPPQGPMSQPGFPPQPGAYQGSAPNYPPVQGPMSQPGLPPQQTSAPGYPPPQSSWPGGYPPPQGQDPYGMPPSWPNMAQPPQGPRKSNKGLIAIISIIVVVVLILGGIGVAFAMRSKGNTTNVATTPTTQSTAATSSVTPTATATQPATSTTSSTGTVSNQNQPVQAGSAWVVTIMNVTATTNSDLPPKAGDTYLEITMALKNASASTQLVSSLLQFSLTDSNGGRFEEALTDTNVRKTPDGNVSAGQTLNAQLAYEVPQSQHHFVLTFDYGLIDGSNSNVTWQITI